jgi:tRNA(adenine34) deaminase
LFRVGWRGFIEIGDGILLNHGCSLDESFLSPGSTDLRSGFCGMGLKVWEVPMRAALAEARQSGDEVPVGALLLDAHGDVLAIAHNAREVGCDPTSHAEIEVIRAVCAERGDWRLEDCTLVVTLEPCIMCAGAIVAARIPRVVFGAWDERVGAAGSLYDVLRDTRLGRPVEVIAGVLETECAGVLREFFEQKR